MTGARAVFYWGTVIARRSQKSLPGQGGWQMYHTWQAGGVCIDPTNKIIRANGQLAVNGWPNIPQVEAELAARFEAQTLDEEKTIARRLNKAVLDHALHAPLGFFLKHQAWRNNVTGIVKGPLPFFWGSATRRPDNCYDAPMLTYVARRILATVPVMAVVALFVFSLLYIAPGDPAAVIAGDQATPADVERIRASLGLDRPFLIRFGEWVWQILHGDLGTSIFTDLPVATMIGQRIEPTLSLMAITLGLSVAIAVPIGVVAAWKAGTWIDRLIMAFAVFGFSVPVFVIGYLLAYVFALELEWLPVQGYSPLADGVGPWLENLILPATALGCVYIALIARMTRAAMLEVLSQDYIRTARAKGIGQYGILFVHALKNAAVPIVTVIGIGIALLIGGAVVTESVFAIPGLGRLTVDAILRRDYPVIQGLVLLFSFVYVLVNLMIDLLYTVLDPRIRY
jgi:peptide/nickel transport system permease protein